MYHLEVDLSHPLFVLVADGRSIQRTDWKSTTPQVGPSSPINAIFTKISGFTQQSSMDVVIVDQLNYCIRRWNRHYNIVMDVAGMCGVRGYVDHENQGAARFTNPRAIVYDGDYFLVSDGEYIRTIKTDTLAVSTLYQHGNEIYSLTLDRTVPSSHVVFASSTQLFRLSLNRTVQVVAGSTFNFPSNDGSLLNATFNLTANVKSLRPGVYIVTETNGSAIRLVNEELDSVSSICSDECDIHQPFGILSTETHLYIGMVGEILVIPSK